MPPTFRSVNECYILQIYGRTAALRTPESFTPSTAWVFRYIVAEEQAIREEKQTIDYLVDQFLTSCTNQGAIIDEKTITVEWFPPDPRYDPTREAT